MDNVSLQTGIEHLTKSKKPAKYIQDLQNANILTIENLLWICPKSIKTIPEVAPFTQAKAGELFHGVGEIENIKRIPVRNSYKKFLMNISKWFLEKLSLSNIGLHRA